MQHYGNFYLILQVNYCHVTGSRISTLSPIFLPLFLRYLFIYFYSFSFWEMFSMRIFPSTLQSLFGKKNGIGPVSLLSSHCYGRAENHLYCRISTAPNQKEINYLRKECTVYCSNTEVHGRSLFLHMGECQEERENSWYLGGHHTKLPRAGTALQRRGDGQCLSQTPSLKNPKI